MNKKQTKSKAAEETPSPLASLYSEVTKDNTEAWTYEKALEVDAKNAEEEEPEAPVKLPPAAPPPGARKHLIEKWEKEHKD